MADINETLADIDERYLPRINAPLESDSGRMDPSTPIREKHTENSSDQDMISRAYGMFPRLMEGGDVAQYAIDNIGNVASSPPGGVRRFRDGYINPSLTLDRLGSDITNTMKKNLVGEYENKKSFNDAGVYDPTVSNFSPGEYVNEYISRYYERINPYDTPGKPDERTVRERIEWLMNTKSHLSAEELNAKDRKLIEAIGLNWNAMTKREEKAFMENPFTRANTRNMVRMGQQMPVFTGNAHGEAPALNSDYGFNIFDDPPSDNMFYNLGRALRVHNAFCCIVYFKPGICNVKVDAIEEMKLSGSTIEAVPTDGHELRKFINGNGNFFTTSLYKVRTFISNSLYNIGIVLRGARDVMNAPVPGRVWQWKPAVDQFSTYYNELSADLAIAMGLLWNEYNFNPNKWVYSKVKGTRVNDGEQMREYLKNVENIYEDIVPIPNIVAISSQKKLEEKQKDQETARKAKEAGEFVQDETILDKTFVLESEMRPKNPVSLVETSTKILFGSEEHEPTHEEVNNEIDKVLRDEGPYAGTEYAKIAKTVHDSVKNNSQIPEALRKNDEYARSMVIMATRALSDVDTVAAMDEEQIHGVQAQASYNSPNAFAFHRVMGWEKFKDDKWRKLMKTWIPFHIDRIELSEQFSNDTGTHPMQSQFQQVLDDARQASNTGVTGNVFGMARGAVRGSLSEAGASAWNLVAKKTFARAIDGNQQIMLPEVWESSGFSQDISFTVNTHAPYGAPLCVFNEGAAGRMLMTLTMPKQTSGFGHHGHPFVSKMFIRGLCMIDLAMVIGLSVNRNTSPGFLTVNHHARLTTYQVTIKNLLPTLYLSIGSRFARLKERNTQMRDYIEALAGYSLDDTQNISARWERQIKYMVYRGYQNFINADANIAGGPFRVSSLWMWARQTANGNALKNVVTGVGRRIPLAKRYFYGSDMAAPGTSSAISSKQNIQG